MADEERYNQPDDLSPGDWSRADQGDEEEDEQDWDEQPSGRGKRRPGAGPSYGRIFLILGVVFLSGVLLVGGFGFYMYSSWRARIFEGDPTAQGTAVFTVRNGDTVSMVLSRLEGEGILQKRRILNDRTLLSLYMEFAQEPYRPKAGTFRLDKSASFVSLLQTLQTGGSREFSLTIPEGKTVREVAELARRKQADFDVEGFVALTTNPDFVRSLSIDEASLEGYLFPSTYDFPPGMKPADLIESMVRNYKRTLAEIQRTTANTTGRSTREIVIIASLIEKEARSDSDRPIIAGVIENRLNRNMRLQIDATVNFALGSWRRLTYADYKFDSTYNTYLHDGLPPGPICSPGAASLRAALDPQESDYIFYVHKGDGHHAFAVTYEEHLANVRAYIKNDPDALRILEEQAGNQANKPPDSTGTPEAVPTGSPETQPLATPKPTRGPMAPSGPRQY